MYKQEINLNHNEIPAKINLETGEVSEIKKRPNNLPEDKIVFEPGLIFRKSYERATDFLLDNLTGVEYKIVGQMASMARMNSNSLNPLNNESSTYQLAEHFNIDRRKVKSIFKKLFKLGIYAEFKFASAYSPTGVKHYWVLNPYISFKGKTIDKGIADLFRESPVTLYVKGQ